MDAYYLLLNGKTLGPMPAEKLAEAGMNHNSFIWKEGMSDWKRAIEVHEVFKHFGSIAATQENAGGVTITFSNPENPSKRVVVSNSKAPKPRKNGVGKASCAFGIIGLIFSTFGITIIIGMPFILTSIITGVLGLTLPRLVERGKGAAIAGLVLSTVAILWAIILLGFFTDEYTAFMKGD